jgi:hypothetical protein
VSLDSAVGIATSYWLNDRGVRVRVPVGSRIFASPGRSDRLCGPMQWVPGTVSPEMKRQGRDADYSTPTSDEVKKTWIYTSTPHTPSWYSVC